MAYESADYLLTRIVDTNVNIGWSDLGWKLCVAILVISLIVVAIVLIWDSAHEDGNCKNSHTAIMAVGFFLMLGGAVMAPIFYVGMLHDMDVLSGLVSSYEAVYGPLPEGIL